MSTGTLYVVGTPIGNLGDLSPRALEVLQRVDAIAAEDTRTTALLLAQYGVTGAKLLPNHKFNEQAAVTPLLERLQSGESIALVTDAGMPCISDPGWILVQAAQEARLPVTVVPGACAAVTAVAISGFNALSFSFYGFLPRSAGEIRKVLARVGKEYAPLSVFYESPNRIIDTVALVNEGMPDARVCVCNDLTKLHERVYRGSPSEVLAELQANPNASKGEYVLLIERAPLCEKSADALSPEALLVDRMVKQGLDIKQAISSLVQEKAAGKKELYDASLRLREAFERKERN